MKRDYIEEEEKSHPQTPYVPHVRHRRDDLEGDQNQHEKPKVPRLQLIWMSGLGRTVQVTANNTVNRVIATKQTSR